MKGKKTKIQKSLSISNKSNRIDKKASPMTMCLNPLGTIEPKQKSKNKYSNLSATLNYSKSKSKGKVKSGPLASKNKKNASLQSGSGFKNKNGNGSQLQDDYCKAVTKVFDVLDIFSRGSISEANISRWVPEAALYFLGSVFQKIRNHRVSMNLQQFQGECMKIYDKSGESDIRWFIDNIFKHENFNDEKISLDGEIKETIESQVEDRFSFPVDGETSFRQIRNGMKTMPLQTIHSKEENTSKEVKLSLFKKNEPEPKPIEKAKLAPLNNMNQFENVAQASRRRIADIENMPLKVTPNQNSKRNPSPAIPGCDSPFFQGSISNVIARTVSGKRRNESDNKIDRIDKLSMRLQDYIRQNAARIERSQNCRRQL